MKKCVILVGPSAVGKTTVGHAMLEMSDRYELVRSVTREDIIAVANSLTLDTVYRLKATEEMKK